MLGLQDATPQSHGIQKLCTKGHDSALGCPYPQSVSWHYPEMHEDVHSRHPDRIQLHVAIDCWGGRPHVGSQAHVASLLGRCSLWNVFMPEARHHVRGSLVTDSPCQGSLPYTRPFVQSPPPLPIQHPLSHPAPAPFLPLCKAPSETSPATQKDAMNKGFWNT